MRSIQRCRGFSIACSALIAPVLCSAATTTTTASYSLQTTYSGSSFFSGFDFFTDPDPTHGFVTYVDQTTAQSKGLITATDGSPVRIGVDYTNTYNGSASYYGINGVGRPSVRVTSKQKYNHGLIIADIANMPGGVCGTWPALWTLGDGTWPYNGEIDIIEGVHTQSQGLSSLHTAGHCSVPGSFPETGTVQTSNCQYNTTTGDNSAGCGVISGDTSSFGANFNSIGGGVYAMEWTSAYIKTWFFRRSAIPADITSGNPSPSGWGNPFVNFQGDCNIDSNFKNHQIVLDTTFCGDWAGNVWADSCATSTGVSSCSVYVGNNPAAFKNMYWSINSIKVFQQSSVGTTTSTSTSTTSSTSSTTSTTSTSTTKPTTTTTTSTTTSTTKPTTTTTITTSKPTTTTTTAKTTSTTSTKTTTSSTRRGRTRRVVEPTPQA
ncbi:putative endo-1,3(4)-beta-glucanase [Xylariales sp. AK1849]|nr:putative endo-1,3(4)-beta-glucanase [Xylariales sp. AK1849]